MWRSTWPEDRNCWLESQRPVSRRLFQKPEIQCKLWEKKFWSECGGWIATTKKHSRVECGGWIATKNKHSMVECGGWIATTKKHSRVECGGWTATKKQTG
jgi:hypothetical protein